MSSYFYEKRRKVSKSILSEEQNYELESVRKDRNIIFTKPVRDSALVFSIAMIMLSQCMKF